MGFIEFHADKCDECFKCLRNCPTKAISFTKDKRSIIDDLCIKCGNCLTQCSRGALTLTYDINYVKTLIASPKKVVATVAPSFAGLFEMDSSGQFSTALKELGFDYVEETARGAEIVSQKYDQVIVKKPYKNIITSCCPSTMYLIQKKYKNAIDSSLAIVSPMVAHGREIKARYGDVFTVFIGPCVAKKAEAMEFKDAIDAVITFRELEEWLQECAIDLKSLESSKFDATASKRGRAYPVGVHMDDSHYRPVHLKGVKDCMDFLDAIEKDHLKGYLAELNICSGSCLDGPEIPKQAPALFVRRQKLVDYMQTSCEEVAYSEIDVDRSFEDLTRTHGTASEDAIYEVLLRMEKYSESDQINCGACGYQTCYDKARAVALGYSDIELCMERLKHKVESLQSIIFENSPNAICILDHELCIQEINPAFSRLFNEDHTKLDGWPINVVIGSDIFDQLKISETKSMSQKLYLESIDKTFYINILKIHDDETYVGIMTDISYEEKNREEMQLMKAKTLDTVHEVINKQMRVAQEIASLLGETTAETKIGLNHLKELVLGEEA